jgi:hypothetical protein
MSILIKSAFNGIGQLPGVRHLTKALGIKEGFKGLGVAASIGVGTVFGYYSYGHTYGTGTAALYGIASAYPITGIPLLILQGGKTIGDLTYNLQKNKQRSSFAKNQINDKFGTINAMRQYSGQKLRRDHSSVQRVLGNEAAYLHR